METKTTFNMSPILINLYKKNLWIRLLNLAPGSTEHEGKKSLPLSLIFIFKLLFLNDNMLLVMHLLIHNLDLISEKDTIKVIDNRRPLTYVVDKNKDGEI